MALSFTQGVAQPVPCMLLGAVLDCWEIRCHRHFDKRALAFSPEVRNFLVGEILDIHMLFGMFNSHTDEMSMAIEFDQNIFVDVSCLGNFFLCEIYEQGIRVRKILHLHHEPSLNVRSKNALCTVSPSSKRITRRYLSSASGIFAIALYAHLSGLLLGLDGR
jgi:hypothetical protein